MSATIRLEDGATATVNCGTWTSTDAFLQDILNTIDGQEGYRVSFGDLDTGLANRVVREVPGTKLIANNFDPALSHEDENGRLPLY
jgi:hypothetical protein